MDSSAAITVIAVLASLVFLGAVLSTFCVFITRRMWNEKCRMDDSEKEQPTRVYQIREGKVVTAAEANGQGSARHLHWPSSIYSTAGRKSTGPARSLQVSGGRKRPAIQASRTSHSNLPARVSSLRPEMKSNGHLKSPLGPVLERDQGSGINGDLVRTLEAKPLPPIHTAIITDSLMRAYDAATMPVENQSPRKTYVPLHPTTTNLSEGVTSISAFYHPSGLVSQQQKQMEQLRKNSHASNGSFSKTIASWTKDWDFGDAPLSSTLRYPVPEPKTLSPSKGTAKDARAPPPPLVGVRLPSRGAGRHVSTPATPPLADSQLWSVLQDYQIRTSSSKKRKKRRSILPIWQEQDSPRGSGAPATHDPAAATVSSNQQKISPVTIRSASISAIPPSAFTPVPEPHELANGVIKKPELSYWGLESENSFKIDRKPVNSHKSKHLLPKQNSFLSSHILPKHNSFLNSATTSENGSSHVSPRDSRVPALPIVSPEHTPPKSISPAPNVPTHAKLAVSSPKRYPIIPRSVFSPLTLNMSVPWKDKPLPSPRSESSTAPSFVVSPISSHFGP